MKSIRTKICNDTKDRGCGKRLELNKDNFTYKRRYNREGKTAIQFNALCRKCKRELDASKSRAQQAKGKGNRNKKELMYAGYDSAEEKFFLRYLPPTEVDRESRYQSA